MDSPRLSRLPEATAVTRSRTSWEIEIGNLHLAVSRTRESRSIGDTNPPAATRAKPFAVGAVAGIGAVGLLVVAASAAPRLPEPYVVSVAIPRPARHHVASPAPRKPAIGRAAGRATASLATFDPADEPYVTQAMATGAFQEWDDALGQRRFLTAGPARLEDGRHCRTMALLVRPAEGGSQVRTADRCTAEPVSDPTPSAIAGDANGS